MFGLGLPDLYAEMQIGKLKELIKHGMPKSVLGNQMQYGLEMMQIMTGVPELILNYNYQKYSHLMEDSWLTYLWRYISDEKLRIKGWKTILQRQRENDEFIMKVLLNYGISKSELATLNKCWLYLQAVAISDIIANGDGTQIAPIYVKGNLDSSRRSSLK